MKKISVTLVMAGLAFGCHSGSPLPTSAELEGTGRGGDGVAGAATASAGTASFDASSASARSRLIEFHGRVESVAPPNLTVASLRGTRTVRTSIATRIERDDRRISLTDVAPGDTVEVEGVVLSDESVLARTIEVEDDEAADDDEIEFTGAIESISGSVIVVRGRTVHVSPFTVIRKDGRRVTLDQLMVGDRVEVEGVLLADGTVLAFELEVRDPDDEDEDDEDEHDDDDDDEDDDDDDDDGGDSDDDD